MDVRQTGRQDSRRYASDAVMPEEPGSAVVIDCAVPSAGRTYRSPLSLCGSDLRNPMIVSTFHPRNAC